MRIWKITVITFLLFAVCISSFGCASKSDSALLSENQIVTVQRGDLVIDITAVGNLELSHKEDLAFEMSGTVGEVLVEEGESVEEGQVLAKLDTSEWEKELATLDNNLLQAELNLQTAEYNLNTMKEVQKAKDAVEDAEWELKVAQAMWREAKISGSLDYWSNQITLARAWLTEAQQNLADILAGKALVTTEVATQVATKNLQVELAQRRLEAAQKAVEEALDASPGITALFNGFITKVNVEGGDEVMKGTVAVTVADPDEFEADILVSEMDIFQVKLGGEAWVQVDAVQGLSLLAEVTHISPTATIQSGVVNYEVTVEVESLEAATQKQQEARQDSFSGELPEDFQLREGLTVTVSIVVDEKNDVLLVPNSAIIRQGQKTYVQVLKDGVTELRAITTGISDWQFTEVTKGLREGEQLIVPQGTATTTTTPQKGLPRKMLPGMGGKGK